MSDPALPYGGVPGPKTRPHGPVTGLAPATEMPRLGLNFHKLYLQLLSYLSILANTITLVAAYLWRRGKLWQDRRGSAARPAGAVEHGDGGVGLVRGALLIKG